MLLFKFDSCEQAGKYENQLSVLNNSQKFKFIQELFCIKNFLCVITDGSKAEKNYDLGLSKFAVSDSRIIFELTKIRYKEFYSKCIPLQNFSSSEKMICTITSKLKDGLNYYAFIGNAANEYVHSLAAHQYTINDILFTEPSCIDDINEWTKRAESKEKVRNIIINCNADFVTDSLLHDLPIKYLNPFINFIVTSNSDIDLLSCYKKVYVEK